MSLSANKQQRQPNGQLESKAPSLFQYMLAIVGINAVLISFLSLLQDDVGRVSQHSLEHALRHASHHRSRKNHAPKHFINYNSPISTNSIIYNGTNTLASKCRDHLVWNGDQIWRNAVLHPELCTTSSILPSLEEQAYNQEQLALLNETIFSNNADFTPCGTYCLYHLDSAYSFQYGHSIYGWTLRMHESKVTETMSNTSSDSKSHKTGCWLPFHSKTEASRCTVHYNDWIGYVEDVESNQRNLPLFEKLGNSDKHFSASPKRVQEQINEYQPQCSQGGDEALQSAE
jgi:hypothetical protein